MFSRLVTLGAFCLLPISILATAAVAAPTNTVYSDSHVYLGNWGGANSLFQTHINRSFSASGELTATGDYTRDFTGLNFDGQTDTAKFAASAASLAQYGSLKARARYSLADAIANDANPSYVNSDFSINQAGVPVLYGAAAIAFSSDTLTVSAGSEVAYLKLSLHLTGAIDAAGGAPYFYYPFVAVRQNQGGTVYSDTYSENVLFSSTLGSFDQILTTQAIPVVGGVASFGLQLETDARNVISPSWVQQFGRNLSGSTDFFSTLTVVRVSAFAADNSPIELQSLNSASGFQYPVSAVPEPQAHWLLLAGLMVLAPLRRRHRH